MTQINNISTLGSKPKPMSQVNLDAHIKREDLFIIATDSGEIEE